MSHSSIHFPPFCSNPLFCLEVRVATSMTVLINKYIITDKESNLYFMEK